jgi:uncharacterized protein (DUF427 family)
MRATWENTVVAESDKTIVVEGNHYFPPDSIKKEFLLSSDTHTTCPWKGLASYYHVGSVKSPIRMRRGITRTRRRRPNRSKATLPFGAA